MVAPSPVLWIAACIRHLPKPLLRRLDAWSHDVARRRAEVRRLAATNRR